VALLPVSLDNLRQQAAHDHGVWRKEGGAYAQPRPNKRLASGTCITCAVAGRETRRESVLLEDRVGSVTDRRTANLTFETHKFEIENPYLCTRKASETAEGLAESWD